MNKPDGTLGGNEIIVNFTCINMLSPCDCT